MSDTIVTDELETTPDTTTTEKVAFVVAGASAAVLAVVLVRVVRKIRKMEAKEEALLVDTEAEATNSPS